MTRHFFSLIASIILTQFSLFGQLSQNNDRIPSLRTDGYYYSYDTLVNTQTNEIIIRFSPIIFFDDYTLSDFYYQKSQQIFESILRIKKYKWVKKFSKFGDYKIINENIFIHQKTWSNKWFGNNRGKIVDAFMKGVIINDTTFILTENIFLGDTIRPLLYYKFIPYTLKK